MAAQYDRIAQLSTLDNVTIWIVPLGQRVKALPWCDVNIYDELVDGEPAAVDIELPHAEVWVTDPTTSPCTTTWRGASRNPRSPARTHEHSSLDCTHGLSSSRPDQCPQVNAAYIPEGNHRMPSLTSVGSSSTPAEQYRGARPGAAIDVSRRYRPVDESIMGDGIESSICDDDGPCELRLSTATALSAAAGSARAIQ
jgi:hypothetical protein